jgi:glycosyltransferase involved in cell wall biosynthesis
MESMAMGVPVVGTSIGGTPELIVDGVTGILVPPSDPEAMASALSQLLDDENLRRTMGAAGRRHFVENLSYAPFYKRIREIYKEALGT